MKKNKSGVKKRAARSAAARKTRARSKSARVKTRRRKSAAAHSRRRKTGKAVPKSAAAQQSTRRKRAGRPAKTARGRGPLGAALRTVERAARRLARAATSAPKAATTIPAGVVIGGKMRPRYAEVLTPGALAFLAELHRKFDGRRRELLARRAEQQQRYDAGELPDFPAETRSVREGVWRVAPIPRDLMNRRVEITGPVDRKMIVNALNSGANVYMADFEDANSPTWANNVEGQINLRDRWLGKIDFTDPRTGKQYKVGPKPAVLIVRPRGWHLPEKHVTVDGEQVSGALFDFALYFLHNARALIEQGTGPYFYLPKLESCLEAALWNDVFVHAQQRLALPNGTIKATVLIETLPAAFEMDEILWEMRDHITGLNAGRWDYIFSFIKKFNENPNYILPDRSQVVMGKAFLRAYALLLIKTCHRRGAFAMGGMAAQIPVKNNPKANEEAFAQVRADKEREVRDGHDGTWVAHPDLVPVAKEVFDRLMQGPNQLNRLREDVQVSRDDLLQIHEGTKTEEGVRLNIRVGVQYIEAWLRGRGAVPIYNLMEDAATAEISRAQIWQWIKYQAELENGTKATPAFFERALDEEMERVKGEIGASAYARGRFPEAISLFREISLAPDFVEFLTIPAYKLID
jgi:malate synthase